MAERDRRSASGAHPGDIVNNTKQKRRTREEIERDNRKKEQEQAEKEKKKAEKQAASVKRVAAIEVRMRNEDETTRAFAARPDLRTAQLKRPPAVRPQQRLHEHQMSASDVASVPEQVSDSIPSPTDDGGDGIGPMDDDNDSDRDPDYTEPEIPDADDVDDADQQEDDAADDDDEATITAKVADYEKSLRVKAGKKKAAKAPKGALRADIREAQGQQATGSKRKSSDTGEPADSAQPAKKSKAAQGGLKKNWHQELGLDKPLRKSTTNWHRTSSSRASSTSATSGPSHPSASSSPGYSGPGELHQDEDDSSLQAARASKSQGIPASRATAQMGITLKKKTLVVDVDGKPKREAKPRYTNDNLPFPADSFRTDLKHYQRTVVPDIVDFAGTLATPFTAHNHPQFKPTAEGIWKQYFTSYPFTDAAQYVIARVVGNWRSAISKRAIEVVTAELNSRATLTDWRDWVAKQLSDVSFLYRDPTARTGSYRSQLFLRTFGVHLRFVLQNDQSFGFQTGAASVVAAALERALSLCKGGSLSTEGLPRKGKSQASSFVTHLWAERAASYLPAIQRLTLQKWQEIYDLGREFTNLTTSALDDPFETSTDGGDSTDDYVDPRSCIVVSDDEDDNPPTGPSHNSSGPTDGESEPRDESESIHVDGG
ncbi:hypothetical protein C8R45DRAFT_1102947 [Mycena sanguinolenta]|nr:hypothetical protein C8R45DRAFT_1102947 [Mycena sanguinolenta]